MHIILAEDIGGWLLAGIVIVGSLATSALALCGIAPAIFAKRVLTFVLTAPAFLMGIGASWWLSWNYFQTGVHSQNDLIENFIEPWLFMAGLPLLVSAIVASILWYKIRHRS